MKLKNLKGWNLGFKIQADISCQFKQICKEMKLLQSFSFALTRPNKFEIWVLTLKLFFSPRKYEIFVHFLNFLSILRAFVKFAAKIAGL